MAWRGGVDIEATTRDPRLRYLEVEANGVRALLVLGSVDPDPAGPVEVWYSADQAVIRLQGGRLLGIDGVGRDWVGVELKGAPALAAVHGEQGFTRTRTEMPGHRYRSEPVRVAPLAHVPDGVPERWRNAGLVWVGESVSNPVGGAAVSLPAVYGLQAGRLVYGRQCLANQACVTWLPLPAGAGKPLE